MTHKFFHKLISLFLALVITLAGVNSAQASDGSLDPTFGAGGIVTTDFDNGSNDFGNDVALQPDGKIIMAGYGGSLLGFALARYNTDGSLDTTFNADGKVTADFGSPYKGGLAAVALQPDSKIIVAGQNYNGSNTDFALLRYNSDGSPDTTFDADGKVTTDFGIGDDYGYAVALQPDGKIIVAGRSYNVNDLDFALARYNSDGSLDTTFDTDGKVTTDFGGSIDWGMDMALQPDGKIIVAGFRDSAGNFDFAVARYNSDGSLDLTFDADGLLTTDFNNGRDTGNAVTLQPDGRIVIAGNSHSITSDIALARYNSDGSLDTTFDIDGRVTTDFGNNDFGTAVVLHPDGRIIVAGQTGQSSTMNNIAFALARYNSNGSLDTTLDGDGMVITSIGGIQDQASGVALQTDGKIILAGSSNNGTDYDFALVRYDGDGSAMEVTIDVKPGRFPNRIELEKNVCKDDDNLYVAILTTPDFDAMTTDGTSLTLGDLLSENTVSPVQSRAKDVDRDGDRDIALTFSLCEMVTQGALNTSSTELVLNGMTLDGTAFTGRDSVKVVGDDQKPFAIVKSYSGISFVPVQWSRLCRNACKTIRRTT